MPERIYKMIITICGTNDFLISQRLKDEKKQYLDKFGEMSVEQIDCEEIDYSSIVSAANSLPFLVPEKLLILRNPSKNKTLVEKLDSVIKDIPDGTKILVIEGKLDKRLSIYKTLKTKTEFYELNELSPAELNRWVIDYVSGIGGSISFSNAQYLVSRGGDNQNKLAKEIDKLVTYEANVTKANIDKLTVRSIKSSIFDLIKSSISGDVEKALQLYEEQKLLSVEAQQIVAMLAWQLNILALLKTAKNLSLSDLAAKSKVSPYSLSQSNELARALTFTEIKKFIEDLYQLDIHIKTKSVNSDQAVQGYILSLQRQVIK
jgi:DNA polymerase-3 subunit delta